MSRNTLEGTPASPGDPSRGTPEAPATASGPLRPLGVLHHVASTLTAQLAADLKAHGLTAPTFHILAVLRKAGPADRLTTGQLAAIDMVTCSGMTVRADKLERTGLIVRERDEHDRRVIHLRLTERGLDLTDRILAGQHAREARLMAALDTDELQALAKLADALERALQHAADGPPPAPPH
ncbi:MarR family winged helix-turn-helix transcriptional regulator [Kitasatospora sp. CB02891]|uniref:MarR family winged helix-turn-helix transcriptional regulator n=1 Tax=Kitasatospora sp. CB02891 TaxID=2020329 RepID=UPI000C26EDA2|nr:MarR family transcriptional regulator [Kitasatospora sp. CB02891]PJN26020.1 MarR family transcriptional regulator [Kitasatospora sp. CB02891]